MGFGGINTHVTITSADAPSEGIAPGLDERALLASHQDSELFLLAEANLAKLEQRINELLDTSDGMSVGEMPDLARQLARKAAHGGASRAVIVASSPQELREHLEKLRSQG